MELREVFSSIVLGDGIACGPDLMRSIDGGYTPDTDRRKRVRLPLTWTVYLLRSTETHPLETKTKNISSEGFYCVLQEPFVIGESIRCTMHVPVFDAERKNDFMFLECQATVVRVEPIAEAYGMACRIDSYKMAACPKRGEPIRSR